LEIFSNTSLDKIRGKYGLFCEVRSKVECTNVKNFIFRICTKHIDTAMERLKSKTVIDEHDLSLVERILANEPDPKTAYILALDLILVGIDTVSDAIQTIH
jgi:hypothetical protein